MTDAQLDDYYELQADVMWKQTLFSDDLRPPDAPTQLVTGEAWAQTIADCMNVAGFDNYQEEGGGLMISSVARPADGLLDEQLAFYSCRSGLRLTSQEDSLHNPAEIDYLYEYYQEVLVPCLLVNDIDIYEAPTRTQFIEQSGWWNPYYSVSQSSLPKLTDGTVLAACPPGPPGMSDQGINTDYLGRVFQN